ncbi:MAG: hypothetical protein GX130_00135 [Candidatus Hydrogenedens sp.]|jgi:hypothetical protein|nr:hypothetical protein [Candidatus Hydrogenedens sp.]
MCPGKEFKFKRRPSSPKPVLKEVYIVPAENTICLSLYLLLSRHGIWNPKKQTRQYSPEDWQSDFTKKFLPKAKLSEDDEIWPLLKSLKVTRKTADRSATRFFTGFAYAWKYNPASHERIPIGERPEVEFLSDPPLCLGILARTHGDFYQANRSPDYSIGHLMRTSPTFSDKRLQGEGLYPLWHWNETPKKEKA